MSETSTGGGGPAPIFIFFAFIVLLAFYSFSGEDGDRSIFGNNNGTTTEETRNISRSSTRDRDTFVRNVAAPEPEPLDEAAVERDIARKYRELDSLTDDLRTIILWEDRSPLEGQVRLSRGNVFTEDYDREYLVLRASGSNKDSVDISGWLIESYVTDEGGTIPFGTRLYQKGRVNATAPILLEPGETAYVITGESPVGISFHENRCTGYLSEFQDFSPSLTRSCPRARDLFEELFFTNDNLYFDDACYDYMRSVSTCEIVDIDDLLRDDDITEGCKLFVEQELNYNSCFDRNVHTPYFDDGQWYIYIGRTGELWKRDRDILRLFDRSGRTVDVLEY